MIKRPVFQAVLFFPFSRTSYLSEGMDMDENAEIREYGAKLLTVEEQPPKISVKKEMI